MSMKMMMAKQAFDSLSQEDKNNIAKIGMVLIQSAPIAALGAALTGIIQWNLEHISLETKYISGYRRAIVNGREIVIPAQRKKYSLRRLSTMDTSILKDPNLTPLSPPVMSMATRLADAGADTAEAALSLAQQHIATNRSSGLVGNIASFLFGG
jgi:hypothetical protein